MNKKAQGLSINTIIVAIIALAVLVVLIVIFTGGIGNFAFWVNDCGSAGNHVCSSGACDTGYIKDPTFKCKGDDDGKTCCLKSEIKT